MKFFDVIILIRSSRNLRLKRFKLNRGNKNLFNLLNNKQMSEKRKVKFCDHVVVNDKNLKFLKKKLSNIIAYYE